MNPHLDYLLAYTAHGASFLAAKFLLSSHSCHYLQMTEAILPNLMQCLSHKRHSGFNVLPGSCMWDKPSAKYLFLYESLDYGIFNQLEIILKVTERIGYASRAMNGFLS